MGTVTVTDVFTTNPTMTKNKTMKILPFNNAPYKNAAYRNTSFNNAPYKNARFNYKPFRDLAGFLQRGLLSREHFIVNWRNAQRDQGIGVTDAEKTR
jgi:hypothetical protein